MFYTVGEMAKKLNVAPSTLRFYDKEGLLPFVERSGGGIRVFKSEDFEWLYIIECLKKTGMSIKDIRTFIEWAVEGDTTIEQRLELFLKRREAVQQQMKDLQDMLDTINYKCWYYETAKEAGSTSVPRNMTLEQVPDDIKELKIKFDSTKKID